MCNILNDFKNSQDDFEEWSVEDDKAKLLSIDQENYSDVFNIGIFAQDIFDYYKRREVTFYDLIFNMQLVELQLPLPKWWNLIWSETGTPFDYANCPIERDLKKLVSFFYFIPIILFRRNQIPVDCIVFGLLK